MKTKQTKTSTAKRLNAYSTLAAATAVAGGTVNAANVYWDIADLSSDGSANKIWFNMPEGSAGVSAGPIVDAEGEFRMYMGGGGTSGFIGQAPGVAGGFAGSIDGSGYVTPTVMTSGASVSGGLTFGAYASGGSDWAYVPTGFDGYLGIQFEIGGETHYGWAEVLNSAGEVTLKSFGYNTTADTAAVPNLATQVPEPSSLALLALGATGLMRRRRQKAA